MDVNTLNTVSNAISATYSKTSNTKTTESMTFINEKDNTAVIYEKTSETSEQVSATYSEKINNKKDSDRSALIQKLQQDAENMKNNLLEIVRKSISKQNSIFAISTGEEDLWKMIASGNFTATAEEIAKAKEDISEDGYWGVKQTSDRIVDFAIALSGGNTEKADLLLNAFKKGFEQATGVWGKELPDISQKTFDAVVEKFDQWKNGTYKSSTEE